MPEIGCVPSQLKTSEEPLDSVERNTAYYAMMKNLPYPFIVNHNKHILHSLDSVS